MKTTFKPLGIAAAVAAVTAGYAGIVNAQPIVSPDTIALAENAGLGDLAIVPYYSVNAGYSTGVSVINTSDRTQIVKIRLRRAVDSMDALDFNVIMSPWDVYTGYVQLEGDEFRFYSNDQSCTAPSYTNSSGGTPYFVMPDIYREGANEGYIEVMGMASADDSQPISIAARHSGGVPADCTLVRDNFFSALDAAGGTVLDYGTAANLNRRGVISSVQTHQRVSAGSNPQTGPFESSTYEDADDVLKVSYFIRDEDSGTEFGNDAVHFSEFMVGASMTNQQLGVFDGDLQGFDFPDLNGGAPFSATVDPIMGSAGRGAYEALRTSIGGASVINDWSNNDVADMFTVNTDWVVTAPGQYLMTNLFFYLSSLADDTVTCGYGDPANAYDSATGANCDFRDIPLTAIATVYDREEKGVVFEGDDLVVSPAPPIVIEETTLDQEVNVIQWGDVDILGADKTIVVPQPAGATAGWANLAVGPNGATVQGICDYTGTAGTPNGKPTLADPLSVECVATSSLVPLVGFVAWQRAFDMLPEANYGRIVKHSYNS